MPVRSTLLGAVTAVAVVAGALTFSSSLNHLLDTPRLYGSDWDAVVTGDTSAADDSGAALLEPTAAALAASSQVEGYAAAGSGAVTLSGAEVPAVGFAQGDRPVQLTLVEGRAPATSDEVVLGSATMRDLDLTVGDSVVVDGTPLEGGETGPPSTLAVVGRAVLPGIAQYSGSDKLSFGRGAIFTADGLQAHSPVSNTVGFVVKLAPDASPSSLEDELASSVVIPGDVEWYLTATPTSRPSDIVSLDRLRSTPVVLSGLLVVLVAGTVANALLAAIRRRRRDLAVLEVFGATRRQVMATVAWQASTIAVVGILVGLPVGVVAGRWIWNALASSMDTIAPPVAPTIALFGTAVVVLALTNLVSVVPGLRAARMRPAHALRSE